MAKYEIKWDRDTEVIDSGKQGEGLYPHIYDYLMENTTMREGDIEYASRTLGYIALTGNDNQDRTFRYLDREDGKDKRIAISLKKVKE